jgi:hypothetical protein
MKAAIFLYNGEVFAPFKTNHDLLPDEAQLVLCFGARRVLAKADTYPLLRHQFPNADIITCSTAGEIFGPGVYDETLSVVAIRFAHTRVAIASVQLKDHAGSYDAAKGLMKAFAGKQLSYLMVLSDGTMVNGSELSAAFAGEEVLVTGGLAGDSDRFEATLVGVNGHATSGTIVGIGFTGDKLSIGHGTKGGWETFGLEREVTRAAGNVLYEIDGKNALDLYRRYLGPDADNLPGSALLFPLSVQMPGSDDRVVRTILAVNRDEGSMTFAGDIPKGARVRFMRANFDKITAAASDAATQAAGDIAPQLALLVSCVGRKLILQSRTDDELEAVDEVFGGKTLLTGFYSYGEISPGTTGSKCQLHNQTMTITTFSEYE